MGSRVRRVTASDGSIWEIEDDSDDPSPTAPLSAETPLQAPPAGKGSGDVATGGQTSWRDDALRSNVLGTAYDAIGGALHGASSGLGDDALDILGMDGADTRKLWDVSRERSPTAFAVGDMAGSVLSPIGKAVRGIKAL